jgi:hypothetical protein
VVTFAVLPRLTSGDGLWDMLLFKLHSEHLNPAYSDPAFTSEEDSEDPMVIVKLDISNTFGSLDTRLVLDVLSGRVSRDYECDIKVDEDLKYRSMN